MRVDQLWSDSYAPATSRRALPAHRPLQHVISPDLRRDLTWRLIRPPIVKRALPPDDLQAVHRREAGRDLIGDPVSEVRVPGSTEILERQDQDAGTSGWRVHRPALHRNADSDSHHQGGGTEEPWKHSHSTLWALGPGPVAWRLRRQRRAGRAQCRGH